jgi:hypothetical protein
VGVPGTGAAGVTGCASITTVADWIDVQPTEFVTVKVYEPAGIPVTVLVVPEPVIVPGPGDLVSVHVPIDGNPLRTTLPVAVEHVGWVIGPTTGAEGVTG